MSTQVARIFSGKSRTTVLVWGLIMAAIYGGSLFATKFIPTIPGITWLRPGNMLSEIFAANFGGTGSIAVMFGNSFGDLLGGQFNPTTLWWVLPLELVFTALIVYWGVTDPSLRTTRGKIEWLVFAVVLQGLLTGFGIAFFVCYVQNAAPRDLFGTIGWTITLNEGIPAIVAGFIQWALFPRIVRMGLWLGRDLETSNVPKELLAELRK